MIKNKIDLEFYIKADQIMNGYDGNSKKQLFLSLIGYNRIIKYLYYLRKVEYYSNCNSWGGKIKLIFYSHGLYKLGLILGFSIAPNVLEYGCVIPHHGTIVVGSGNKIGKYCVLHTSTCITAGKKIIGDGFYLSTGCKVYKNIKIGDNVSVTPNSVVNISCDSNSLMSGMPASNIRSSKPWYVRDGERFSRRVALVEKLKYVMYNN